MGVGDWVEPRVLRFGPAQRAGQLGSAGLGEVEPAPSRSGPVGPRRPVSCSVVPVAQSRNSSPASGLCARLPRVIIIALPG